MRTKDICEDCTTALKCLEAGRCAINAAGQARGNPDTELAPATPAPAALKEKEQSDLVARLQAYANESCGGQVEADLLEAARLLSAITPIDMLLWCPQCGEKHVDYPDERTPGWTNPPHRSHLCHGCGHIWRPADVPTNGVEAIKTKGQKDGNPSPRYFATAKDFNDAIAAIDGRKGG